MPDIYHTLHIHAPLSKVFEAVSTPAGLDRWWTKSCSGKCEMNTVCQLYFSPEYIWKAKVTKCKAHEEFELQMTEADSDWLGTRVGFTLHYRNGITEVNFYHKGWPRLNDHYKRSSYCWAMYLRTLKHCMESGEQTPYEKRLDS